MRVCYIHLKVCLSYYGGTEAEGVQGQVARKILGPKKDMATGRKTKLNNKELHDLYCSLNITRLIIYRRI
jgi:hypothetical protein